MILIQNNFYSDINSLLEITTNLEFKDSFYGQEVEDFNFIPPDLTDYIRDLLSGVAANATINIIDDSGIFRKPYNNILHFENYNPNIKLAVLISLEDGLKYTTYKHKLTNIIDYRGIKTNINNFIEEDMVDINNFDIVNSIKLSKNQVLVFNPYEFHSFNGKLVHVFYLDILPANA